MTDPEWTPEAAYSILRNALGDFLAGTCSATQLHAWLIGSFGVPVGTSKHHPVQNLWRLAVVDTAIYTQCDFSRDELADSLQQSMIAIENGEEVAFSKLMITPCFFEMIKKQQAPAPLVNHTAQRIREQWEREGFREI